MFTRSDIVALSTWRIGKIGGFEIRWLDVPPGSDELVEVYSRLYPDEHRWHIWCTDDRTTWMRRLPSGEAVAVASVASALHSIVSADWPKRRVGERHSAAEDPPCPSGTSC